METEGIINVTERLTPAETRHLKAMEGRIERGMHTFQVVGEALLDIRNNRLYRETHDTFEAYCRDRWEMTRERAGQFIGAAEVVKVLGEGQDEGPVNEAQARELVVVARSVGPEAVQTVWKAAQESGKPLTAAVIREEARKVIAPETAPPPSQTDALVSRISGIITAYNRWLTSKPTRKERGIVSAALTRLNEVTGVG